VGAPVVGRDASRPPLRRNLIFQRPTQRQNAYGPGPCKDSAGRDSSATAHPGHPWGKNRLADGKFPHPSHVYLPLDGDRPSPGQIVGPRGAACAAQTHVLSQPPAITLPGAWRNSNGALRPPAISRPENAHDLVAGLMTRSSAGARIVLAPADSRPEGKNEGTSEI